MLTTALAVARLAQRRIAAAYRAIPPRARLWAAAILATAALLTYAQVQRAGRIHAERAQARAEASIRAYQDTTRTLLTTRDSLTGLVTTVTQRLAAQTAATLERTRELDAVRREMKRKDQELVGYMRRLVEIEGRGEGAGPVRDSADTRVVTIEQPLANGHISGTVWAGRDTATWALTAQLRCTFADIIGANPSSLEIYTAETGCVVRHTATPHLSITSTPRPAWYADPRVHRAGAVGGTAGFLLGLWLGAR